MKRLLVIALAIGLAAPALADPVEGLWKTKPDDNGKSGLIQIAPCGAKLCGTLIKSFNPDGTPFASPNIGRKIVWDMQAKGGGGYGGGQVWAPDRDKTYASKMQLTGDSLAISGCAMGGLVCRSGGTWTREK